MTQKSAPAKKDFPARLWGFVCHLWHDHDFWIRALAVKGGASAIVVAGVMGISYVIALPFFVAALGIGLCGALIALGLYGVFLGAAASWEQLQEVYYATFFSGRRPPKAARGHRWKFSDNPRIHRLLSWPPVQKLLHSRAWKMTTKLTEKQRDLFLTGLAGTGSMFWGVISALTLVTQIIVLPVVAVGSFLTFGTALAVGGFLSGVYGVYLSIDSLLRFLSRRKKKK